MALCILKEVYAKQRESGNREVIECYLNMFSHFLVYLYSFLSNQYFRTTPGAFCTLLVYWLN